MTIDKLEGCTTGVSAADRAATIQALADPASTPATFGRPGHINPLYAQEKVYYVVPGIQKLRLIWPVWQVFILRVHLWKS